LALSTVRGMQSQQSNGVLFGIAGIEHDLVVFSDYALGERRISVQQRRVASCIARLARAHISAMAVIRVPSC
jgi:hypothetical protein